MTVFLEDIVSMLLTGEMPWLWTIIQFKWYRFCYFYLPIFCYSFRFFLWKLLNDNWNRTVMSMRFALPINNNPIRVIQMVSLYIFAIILLFLVGFYGRCSMIIEVNHGLWCFKRLAYFTDASAHEHMYKIQVEPWTPVSKLEDLYSGSWGVARGHRTITLDVGKNHWYATLGILSCSPLNWV